MCGVIAGQTILAARWQNLARARRTLLDDISKANAHTPASDGSKKNLDNAPRVLAKLRSKVRFSVMTSAERQPVDFASQRQSILADLQAATDSTSNARDARTKLFDAGIKQSQQAGDNVTKIAGPDEVAKTAGDAAPIGAPVVAAGTPPPEPPAKAASGQPGVALPSIEPEVETASVISRLQWDVQWVQNVTPNPSYTGEVAAIAACQIGL